MRNDADTIPENDRNGRLAALIVVAGLVASAAYLWVRGSLFFGVDDPNRYLLFAYDWAHHGAYSAAQSEPFRFSALRPPGYPLFLLPFVLLPQRAIWGAVLLGHVTLVLASAFFVHRTTRALTGSSSTSALAVALFGVHIELLLASLVPLEHAFFTFLVCAMVYVRFGTSGRARPMLLGILGGLSYLTRPTGLLTSGLLLLDAWFERERSVRDRLRTTAAIAFAMLLVALPWHVALRANLGTWAIFPSTTNGLNLYKGNNADFFTYFPYVDVDAADGLIADGTRERLGAAASDEVAVDRHLRDQGVRYAFAHPLETAKALPWKVAYLYSPLPTPLARGELEGELGHLALRNLRFPTRAAMLARSVRALPVCVLYVGVFLFVRDRQNATATSRRFGVFTLAIFALLTLAHTVTFSETRYRLPFDPLLCVLAAIGFSRFVRRRRGA